MATRVTIQDIANELQLSRSTVSKAINNTGVLADATREKILRKAAEMGYKQFAYLPLFQPESAAAPADAPTNAPAEAEAQPGGKREIAMMTTCFLSNSHFSSMMLGPLPVRDPPPALLHDHLPHLPEELRQRRLPSAFDPERTAGIICFEVFDYEYAQMLCEQGIPILFADSP